MNNFIRGLFFGALASVVATPNKPKTPIRGVSHAKYRKMQRKNRKKLKHQRSRC